MRRLDKTNIWKWKQYLKSANTFFSCQAASQSCIIQVVNERMEY